MPAIPVALGAGNNENEVVVIPPPPPPPPLSDELRQQLDPEGAPEPLLDPPLATFDFGDDPSKILDGLAEDLDARSSSANVFKVWQGGHLIQAFSQPVNYQDEAGDWVPISTDLVEDGKGGLKNEANSFTTDFPEDLSTGSPIEVSLKEGSYTFSLEGATGAQDKLDDDSLGYAAVLSGVGLSYDVTNLGYEETITLDSKEAASQALVFDLYSKDLSFRQEKTGEVSVLSAGEVVAILPAPFAFDSSVDPDAGEPTFGDASYELKDLGGGSWTLALTVDSAFLDSALYPVMVDPGTVTLNPGRDTWVDEQNPGTSYESGSMSDELRAGNYITSYTRYGFVNFYVGNYIRSKRTVIAAQASLWPTYVANSSVDVNVKRVEASWPASGSFTWNTKPTVGTTVWDSHHGGTGNWYSFDLTDLYQNIMDSDIGWTNYGVRLGGDGATPITDNYHRFASSKTSIPGAEPQLYVYFNDPPSAPTLSSPPNAEVFNYSSPTLKIASIPGDNNGDDVLVNYQISETSDFDDITVSSGFIDEKSWTVPAGNLLDGKSYYWRVQSWDVCGPGDEDMCPTMGRDHPDSASRTFTVTLNHFGMDTKWPMWTDHLGNGMTLAVNEASGNLHLSYPLDSIPTPIGNLDLSLAYNHQDGTDNGLGQGWWISAGPGSDPLDLPTKLTSVNGGDAEKITLRDGNELYFSKVEDASTNIYTGSGSGVVQKNSDGTYLYTTASGGQYTFSATRVLTSASPAQNTSTLKTFSYVFSANGHLRTVTDPLGRVLTLNWNPADTQLTNITTWDGHVWTFAYDPVLTTMIKTVTDPEAGVVTFAYNDTPRRLTAVTDGTNYVTSVIYNTPPAGVAAQVASVQDAGYGSADRTEFTYNGPYTGQVPAQTIVHDPRWNDPSTAFTTTTDFNTAGLPVKVSGPGNNLGILPVTTMVWDKNGNLVCKRETAANAVDATKCTATDSASDSRQTDYTYDTRAPHRLLTETGPDPDGAGPGTRPVTTYAYDEGITGLFAQDFSNDDLSGIPAYEWVATRVNNDWGQGHPTGITVVNHFSVRWTGRLYVSAEHKYHFRLYSDDGAILVIGTSVLTDCLGDTGPYAINCSSGADAIKKLYPGYHPITVSYEEQTGDAHIELQWDHGTGGTDWEILPEANFTPDLGLMTTKTDPLGTTTYAYSTDAYQVRHLPSSMTRSNAQTAARTTTYTYDDYGRGLTEANAAGTITNTYAADATLLDCLTRVVDRANAQTDHTCSSAGDVLTTTLTVPAVDQQPSQTRLTTKTYDQLGRVKTIVTNDGTYTRTITNTYDHSGRLTQTTDVVGSSTRTTTYDYDTHGRLWHETLPDPDGGGPLTSPVTTHVYDQVGNETSTTDPRNKVWTEIYDAINRAVSSSDPVASPNTSTTITDYDDDGMGAGGTPGIPTTKVTDPSGVITLTSFDLAGRKTSVKIGSPPPTTYLAATTFEYDAVGNVTKVTDPTGVWTTSEYNAFSEVTKTTAPTGTNGAVKDTIYTYDTAGCLSTVKDANNNDTGYICDAMSRITSVTPPGLGQGESPWAIHYDAAGERVRVIDPNGRTRDWTYDTLGRVSTYRETRNSGYVCPRSGTNVCLSTYHYTGFGELSSVDDPRSATLFLNFVYDNLSRKTQRYGVQSSQTIDSETYSYDAASHMTQAVSGAATTNITYDNAGRTYQVTQGSATTTFNFTKNRLTSRVDPAGTTSYGYDGYGRLNSITAPFSGLPNTTYTFDAAGRQLTRTDPSGLVTTRTYDTTSPGLSGRLLSDTVKLGITTKASFTYTYDPVGNVMSQDLYIPPNPDSGKTWAYTYDAQNRLKTAQLGTNPITTYGYDGAGNRSSVQVGTGTPVTTTYDSSGLPVSGSDGSTYSFDSVGNMLTVTGPSRNWTFSFDSWSRTKTAIASGNNPSITYTLDALDRMITRVRNGTTTTNYAYVGTTEDPAKTTQGSTTTYYAYSPGGPLAQKVGTTVKIYEPNLHGDLSLMSNTSGSITGTASFGPFGDKRSVTGDTSYFSFQSDPTDGDTGFVDMGTRAYDPQTGRFSSRDSLIGDPKTPMSLNQYVYGLDNPVSLADPDGMCPRDPDNISGCGYTTTSHGGVRYDFSFGKKPLPWIPVPPAPPIPPPPPIMWTESRDLYSGFASLAGRETATHAAWLASQAALTAKPEKHCGTFDFVCKAGSLVTDLGSVAGSILSTSGRATQSVVTPIVKWGKIAYNAVKGCIAGYPYGAIAGAAVGAIAGPSGAAAGSVIGAVAGCAAGGAYYVFRPPQAPDIPPLFP